MGSNPILSASQRTNFDIMKTAPYGAAFIMPKSAKALVSSGFWSFDSFHVGTGRCSKKLSKYPASAKPPQTLQNSDPLYAFKVSLIGSALNVAAPYFSILCRATALLGSRLSFRICHIRQADHALDTLSPTSLFPISLST